MKTILEQMNEAVKSAFETCGYDGSRAVVQLSNRPDLCEYQCNGAMAAAKAARKKPIESEEQAAEGEPEGHGG